MSKIRGLRVHTYVELIIFLFVSIFQCLFTAAKWCVHEQIPFQVLLNDKFLKKEKGKLQFIPMMFTWKCLNNSNWTEVHYQHAGSPWCELHGNTCICKSRSFTECSEWFFFLRVGEQLPCNLCRLWGGCSCRPTAARRQWLAIINMADYVLHCPQHKGSDK